MVNSISRPFKVFKKDLTDRQQDYLLLTLDIPFKHWLTRLHTELEDLPERLPIIPKDSYIYLDCLSGKITSKRSLLQCNLKDTELVCLGQGLELISDLQQFSNSKQYIDRLISRQLKLWLNSRSITTSSIN